MHVCFVLSVSNGALNTLFVWHSLTPLKAELIVKEDNMDAHTSLLGSFDFPEIPNHPLAELTLGVKQDEVYEPVKAGSTLADFINKHVVEDKDSYVPQQDLLEAYVDWRQGCKDIMQLRERDVAKADMPNALPQEAFAREHMIDDTMYYNDVWVGYKLNWTFGGHANALRAKPQVKKPVVLTNWDLTEAVRELRAEVKELRDKVEGLRSTSDREQTDNNTARKGDA